MKNAASVVREVAEESALSDHAAPIGFEEPPQALSALTKLEQCAKTLGELRSAHRSATLSAAATGALTADEAIVRVDTVRRLEALAHHAWRSAAHLVGAGG
jgi:phosphate:Na+ symporter